MNSSLFRKLNLKNQNPLWVINPPESFSSETESVAEFVKVLHSIPEKSDNPQFILAFTYLKLELEEISEKLIEASDNNTVLWFAYPKQSSKKYKCDFNRDNGWDVLKAHGYEGVRMVSIDDDWSALRFKKRN